MRILLPLLLALPLPVFAEACPPVPDRSDEVAEILTRIQSARNEGMGRPIFEELWLIWTDAPDETAQEMLDRGMRARSSYDWDGALAAFDDLVAYCPAYAEGYNQRAFVNFLRGNYAAALPDLEKALEIDPIHVAAMSGSALTLLRLGREAAGQAMLRDALKLNPWLPERYLLAEPEGEDI